MKFVSRKLHAVLDYLSAIVLIGVPYVFEFQDEGMAYYVAMLAGVFILLMSILTRYEGGLVHWLPMSAHLSLDILLGIFLCISPWLLGFSQQTYLPHLIMGIIAICTGIFSNPNSIRSDL